MKIFKVIALLCTIMASVVNAETLKFPKAGFSIDALDSPPNQLGVTPLQMFLPPVSGFAANISVQIQPYGGTLDAYLTLTKAQFTQVGWMVLSEAQNEDELVLEYEGDFQGLSLRWYARAVKAEGLVYLITATDTQASFEQNKDVLMETVNSFALN